MDSRGCRGWRKRTRNQGREEQAEEEEEMEVERWRVIIRPLGVAG